MEDQHVELNDDSRYLLYRIGDEIFGSPLLSVREVVEPQEPKPVPGTVDFYKGVINIRGQIVGVIDMRTRFGAPEVQREQMSLMVFDTDAGPIAALVDKVEAVAQIPDSKIDSKPNVKTHSPVEYLLGIAHVDQKLVTLIDLDKVLASEDLKFIQSATMHSHVPPTDNSTIVELVDVVSEERG